MRFRRCVSGISDKSTRKTALRRSFSAKNSGILHQLYIVCRETPHSRAIVFEPWPANSNLAHTPAHSMLFGELHRSSRQRARGRLWLNDGSCIRLRPEHRNHVWAYDFVFDRTREGRPLKFLTVVDEYTRECLTIEVARKQTSRDVLRTLAKLMLRYGVPKHIRSDNGPEFVAKAVRDWLSRLEVGTLFIEPGSPWENGYIESFNGKLRDELLNGEIFTTLEEARVLTKWWRWQYNHIRPHSSLGYRPPAPEAVTKPLTAAIS